MKREEKIRQHQAHQKVNLPTQKVKDVPFDYHIQRKEFISIEEAAKLLGASRRTIQRLIAKGSLKVGKVGRRSIIQRSEIDKLFQ